MLHFKSTYTILSLIRDQSSDTREVVSLLQTIPMTELRIKCLMSTSISLGIGDLLSLIP